MFLECRISIVVIRVADNFTHLGRIYTFYIDNFQYSVKDVADFLFEGPLVFLILPSVLNLGQASHELDEFWPVQVSILIVRVVTLLYHGHLAHVEGLYHTWFSALRNYTRAKYSSDLVYTSVIIVYELNSVLLCVEWRFCYEVKELPNSTNINFEQITHIKSP